MPRKKQFQWDAASPEGHSSDTPSRSEKKRRSHALQGLGEELTRLGAQELAALDLPPDLLEALRLHARIRDHEGRRRQMQYIGRLMRDLDPAPVRAALEAGRLRSSAATAAMHQAEQWRDRLLHAPDAELPQLLEALPGKEPEQGAKTGQEDLPDLVRAARAELAAQKPPHARRALFRALHRLLTA